VAVEAFSGIWVATRLAGLMNAVNMDTGYVNYLSDAEEVRRFCVGLARALGPGVGVCCWLLTIEGAGW